MKQAAFAPLREALLAKASGSVLEIGFGTGANVPYYARDLRFVTAIDPNAGMVSLARAHAASTRDSLVRWVIASGEMLPFPGHSFDTVVSTLTLCSIPQIAPALQELYRVLKPGGRFLFLEHGQSPDPAVRRWQDRLTPCWKYLGDGCHLNRPMAQLIQAHPWSIKTLEMFYLPGVPRPFAYFYQGMAVKLD